MYYRMIHMDTCYVAKLYNDPYYIAELSAGLPFM